MSWHMSTSMVSIPVSSSPICGAGPSSTAVLVRFEVELALL